MAIIENYNLINPFVTNHESTGTFQISQTDTVSESVNFFEQLYSCPQKFTLKWDALTETKNDLPCTLDKKNTPRAYKWIPDYKVVEKASIKPHLFSEYKNGYLNKLTSSNFYKSKTKDIQTALSNIPIFVVLNGDNEIILNKVSNPAKPTTLQSFVNQNIYNSCGAFDLNTQNNPDLGLFFFDSLDAENYLNSVAKVDIDGTKTVGLSIHCCGLDSAYKIMRAHHPGVDFRFVPQLSNFKNVRKNGLGVSVYKVEFSQDNTGRNCVRAMFFNEKEALNFYKEKSKNSKNVNPKFSTLSFENFLELWEEQLHSADALDHQNTSTVFITSNEEQSRLNNNKVKLAIRALGQKTRILKRFIGIFFSAT